MCADQSGAFKRGHVIGHVQAAENAVMHWFGRS